LLGNDNSNAIIEKEKYNFFQRVAFGNPKIEEKGILQSDMWLSMVPEMPEASSQWLEAQ